LDQARYHACPVFTHNIIAPSLRSSFPPSLHLCVMQCTMMSPPFQPVPDAGPWQGLLWPRDTGTPLLLSIPTPSMPADSRPSPVQPAQCNNNQTTIRQTPARGRKGRQYPYGQCFRPGNSLSSGFFFRCFIQPSTTDSNALFQVHHTSSQATAMTVLDGT